MASAGEVEPGIGNPGISTDPGRCTGCKRCQLACSFRRNEAYSLTGAEISIEEGDFGARAISFTEDCDLCYLCVAYCEYGALKRA